MEVRLTASDPKLGAFFIHARQPCDPQIVYDYMILKAERLAVSSPHSSTSVPKTCCDRIVKHPQLGAHPIVAAANNSSTVTGRAEMP